MAKPLTKQQAQDLVNHFGGIRPAARATGLHRSTIGYWLNPEKARAQRRRAELKYRKSLKGKKAREREWIKRKERLLNDAEYREKYREWQRKGTKSYREKEKNRKKRRSYERERYANDPNYRLKDRIRNTLYQSKKKVERSEEYLKQLQEEAKNA